MPNHTNEKLWQAYQDMHRLWIKWEHIRGIDKRINDSYGYQVEYKEVGTGSTFISSGVVSYGSEPRLIIENLKSNTNYEIKVTPFREYKDIQELATPYKILMAKTDPFGKLNVCRLNA